MKTWLRLLLPLYYYQYMIAFVFHNHKKKNTMEMSSKTKCYYALSLSIYPSHDNNLGAQCLIDGSKLRLLEVLCRVQAH